MGSAVQSPDRAQGFSFEELKRAGLAGEGNRGPIDRFHRRLLWAIHDAAGDVVGFGARRLYDDDRLEAKYINTSETPLYKKSQLLYGLDLAKKEIARQRQVVVVEGYTDVMAMHLAGGTTAVASCGTAFGDEHISVLRRYLADNEIIRGQVIYTFDGDSAGQKAALKAFDSDQRFAANTFVAVAPDGMDPCELRQARGDGAVRELVAGRRPLFEFAVQVDPGRLRPEHGRGSGRGCGSGDPDRGPHQGVGVAERVRAAACRLAGRGPPGHRGQGPQPGGCRGQGGQHRGSAGATRSAVRGDGRGGVHRRPDGPAQSTGSGHLRRTRGVETCSAATGSARRRVRRRSTGWPSPTRPTGPCTTPSSRPADRARRR